MITPSTDGDAMTTTTNDAHMRSGFAIAPPRSIWPAPEGVSEKVHAYRQVADRAKALAAAQAASEKAADSRALIETGSTRARITTANARWMQAAEDRDCKLASLELALVEAGLSPVAEA